MGTAQARTCAVVCFRSIARARRHRDVGFAAGDWLILVKAGLLTKNRHLVRNPDHGSQPSYALVFTDFQWVTFHLEE